MIQVTELRGKHRYINADLIEFIETAPETQVVMREGRRIFVRETPAEIVARVIDYKQRCNNAPPETRQPAEEESAGKHEQI